jgi:UDP-N-acetylmuramyl pentapeptide phosphotransferase/UDP-N-acetylglucosamine-1-phosphate transferase
MIDLSSTWNSIGLLAPGVWIAALVVSSGLIAMLFPVFGRFALAVPTERSSHNTSTPQWGGLAVVTATVGITATALLFPPRLGVEAASQTSVVLLGATLLWALGVVDDLRPLAPALKFIVQAMAVFVVLAALPEGLRVVPFAPLWLERVLLFVSALWLVNLVNFMDGIDWMMVAEVVPVTAGVALIGILGALPPEGLVVALALNGAMLGFAPFNRPVARLFLGDMGSLPIALLLAWLLILVAGSGHLVAAVLLPFYFVADATVTLVRRLLAGERVWEAHRTHFYQRASDNGFTNLEIVARVAAANLGLVVLAAVSVVAASLVADMVVLALGVLLVAWLLVAFSRRRA